MAVTQEFTSNGVLKVFTISEFDFLRKTDLKVFIDPTGDTVKTLVLENTGAQAGQYTINETAKTITFISSNIQGTLQTNDGSGNAGAPLAGKVYVERFTNVSSPINTFQAGSSITASALNDSLNQLRFNIQEYGTITNSGSLSSTDKGDITVSNSGNTWTIDNDAITGDKLANHVTIIDNNSIKWGDSGDLQILHDSNNSIIRHTGGGELYLQCGSGEEILITSISTPHNVAANFVPDGAVTLNYGTGSAAKLATTAAGVNVTGSVTSSTLTDNRVLFGGTAGLIEDSANLTFDGTTLAVTGSTNIDNITIDNRTISTSSGDLTIDPAGGTIEIAAGTTKFKNPGAICALEVGADPSGDHSSYIDLIGCDDNDDEKDYGLRVMRTGGIGGASQIRSRGTGAIDLIPEGTAAPVKLYYAGAVKIETTAGGCTVTGSVTETSDIALKENIQPLSNSLTNLKQLNGYSFKFKDTGAKSLGFTAQEVEKVYPDLVVGEEGKKGVHYSGLIAPLLEAIKELSTEVETLKTKVAALEAK